jgi:hypothetical protein
MSPYACDVPLSECDLPEWIVGYPDIGDREQVTVYDPAKRGAPPHSGIWTLQAELPAHRA